MRVPMSPTTYKWGPPAPQRKDKWLINEHARVHRMLKLLQQPAAPFTRAVRVMYMVGYTEAQIAKALCAARSTVAEHLNTRKVLRRYTRTDARATNKKRMQTIQRVLGA